MTYFYNGNANPVPMHIKRVVIAPHADDEVLGCGGLLAKYPSECGVVILAEPDDVRLKEFEAAKEVLGYGSAHIMGLADGYVGHDLRRITSLMDNVVNAFQPQELYIPYPSMHQDHIAAYEAGIRSSRLSMGSAHWFTPNLYVYDVAAYETNLYATQLSWNVTLALTEEEIDKKVEALRAYSSQVAEGPHPVNGIKEIAHAIGASRQTYWAEKYALVRGCLP